MFLFLFMYEKLKNKAKIASTEQVFNVAVKTPVSQVGVLCPDF